MDARGARDKDSLLLRTTVGAALVAVYAHPLRALRTAACEREYAERDQ